MRELKRILLDKPSPLERRMLQGGALEQPTLPARRRMAQALGLSPLIAYTSAAKAVLGSWWVQAGLGIALAGATALGAGDIPPSEGVSGAAPPSAVSETAPPPAAKAKPPVAVVAPERPVKHDEPAAAAPVQPRKAPPPLPERAREMPSKSKLGQEISLIDRARTLLAHGRADRALVVLDKYDTAFPRGVLAPEAQLLRRRALQ